MPQLDVFIFFDEGFSIFFLFFIFYLVFSLVLTSGICKYKIVTYVLNAKCSLVAICRLYPYQTKASIKNHGGFSAHC